MSHLTYDELINQERFDIEQWLFGGFYDEGRTEQANKILNELIAKYGPPSCGRNRATFRLKNHVFKFPMNDNGEADNDWEGSVSATDDAEYCYAKSRWIKYRGFICVMAEIIEEVPYDELPDWAKWSDGAGRCKKGFIKIYDYGIR